jgi:triacylglycerol lipase
MGALMSVPPGFNLELAVDFANLILAAYDEYKIPVGRASKWPLTSPWEWQATFSARLPFHETESFGFVARRSDTGDIYVAFRGTESVDDWLINVEIRQVPQPDGWGRVEAGFADVYEQCASTIRAAIRDQSPRRVFVTGHSLGSALATLCAADVKATSGITPTLYTFASPRLGNPAFASRFNAECPVTWRVVNTEDIITTVPPPTSVLDTKHRDFLAWLIQVLARVPLVGTWVRHRLGWTRVWRSDEVYEHVGTPIAFTQNTGTVLANHDMALYVAALRLPPAPASSE